MSQALWSRLKGVAGSINSMFVSNLNVEMYSLTLWKTNLLLQCFLQDFSFDETSCKGLTMQMAELKSAYAKGWLSEKAFCP